MRENDYELADEDAEDSEILQEIKKSARAKSKAFAAIINKKKLRRYELDELMH